MKDPKEIAQQIADDVCIQDGAPRVYLRAMIAAAIQADREEREKEHQEVVAKLTGHLVYRNEVMAERDALRKELADCQLVSEDMSIELDKLLEAARLAKGSRDVHNVYEVLDLIPALRKAGLELLTAMETCHICQGTLVPEDGPIHCEDCSSDCEDHEGEPCISLSILRRNLGQLIGPELQPEDGL